MKRPHSNLYKVEKYADIREALKAGVRNYPNNIAFTLKEKNGKEVKYIDITYTELEKQVIALGTGLLNLGLKDKKIAIIGPNSYQWVLSYITILCGVGVVVPLDKGLPDQEIIDSVERSEADCIIFDEKYMNVIDKISKNNTDVKQFICMQENETYSSIKEILEDGKKLVESGNEKYKNAEIDREKASVILFTSGTTSLSKAVMLSHKNIVSDINSMNMAEKLLDTDVNLIMLPFHHTFGSTGILMMLTNGVKNVFCDGLRHIQENMKEYKVSVFVCVPLILEAMHKKVMLGVKKKGLEKKLQFAKKLSKILLGIGIDVRKKLFKSLLDEFGGNMRFVVSGAAAIDKQVAEDFNAWGILTIQGYGLTETSPVLCAENEKFIKYGSVGVPLQGIEVKIFEPDDKGIGEIIAKGDNVMIGYYNNEQATKETLVDGWYHTGDLGYYDDEGYLFITGRKKNVIVLKNGKNIFPEEIEVLVNNLPYVTECLVFGLPKEDDLVLSAKIVYDEKFVKANYNMSIDEFKEKVWQDIKEINTTVPKYKHIKKIVVTDEPMIKTTTAKIKRFEEIEKIIKDKQIEI